MASKAKKPTLIDYEISVTRTLTLTTTIPITAATEDEAEAQATKLAYAGALTWDITDSLDWQEDDDVVRVEAIDEA